MRRNTASISRKLEAQYRQRDETMPVEDIPTNLLWACVYRLQQRRNAEFGARIAALNAEQARREGDQP